MSDIGNWLEQHRLGQHTKLFVENEIDLELLPYLTEEDIHALGLPVGARRRLRIALDGLEPPTAGGSESGPPLPSGEAEHRQLTVMFCDLVGSTELSQRFDPEVLREISRAYQDEAKKLIERRSGYVARYMGDGVLAYFGYPEAHEDDAEQAVRAGLDLVASIPKVDTETTLAVRVGIATGGVVVGDIIGEGASQESAVVGETPNVAARLQGVAEPDTVVVSDGCHSLLGRQFDCVDLGELELKGLSEPVRAWRVGAEQFARSRFESSRDESLTRFVGREQEVELLLERWRQAKGGEGQVVLLSGEAGLGKSRITETLRERIRCDEYVRIQLQCSPHYVASPLYPVIRHLEYASQVRDEDPPIQKLEKLEELLAQSLMTPEAAALAAELLSIPTTGRYAPLAMSPEEKKARTLEMLIDQFEGLTNQCPVLFVLEDAHWIDPTTHEWLETIIDRVRELRSLVVITYRPERAPTWPNQGHHTTLTLNRLTHRQAAFLAKHVGQGRTLPAAVLKEIVAKTDGIPLFIEEFTKTVLESELMGSRDEDTVHPAPLPALGIPSSLQDSLMARLDRMAGAKEIAQLASVVGRNFSWELLKTISQLPESALEAGVSALVDAGLVNRRRHATSEGFEFKHALVRDIAYASLLRMRRQELHRHIADVLTTRFAKRAESEPEVLAHHYSEGGMVEMAIDSWVQAAQRAAKRSADHEAVTHFTSALEMVNTLAPSVVRDERELEIQIGLGGSLLMTKGAGQREVESAYSRARELSDGVGDTFHLVPALFGLWRYYIGQGDCRATADLGRQLLELSESANDMPARIVGHYGLGYTLLCSGEIAVGSAHLDDGAQLYGDHSQDALSFPLGQDPGVACLSYGAMALWLLGYPDAAVQKTQRALALAESLLHPFSRAFALSLACQVYQLRSEPGPTLDHAEIAIDISAEQGFAVWLASPQIFRGWARCRDGDTAAGVEEMKEAVAAIHVAGMDMRRPLYLALLAEGHLLAGHPARARTIVDEALALIDSTGECWSEAELYRLDGEILTHSDPSAAEKSFAKALSIARRQGAKSWELRTAVSTAKLWRGTGRNGAALALLVPIVEWFTEGLGAPDLVEARNVIAGLS